MIGAGLALLVLAGVLHRYETRPVTAAGWEESFSRFISERTALLGQAAGNFVTAGCKEFSAYTECPRQFNSLYAKNGLAFFIYDQDKLLFWTSNAVPVTMQMIRYEPDDRLWRLKNGWYRVKRYEGKNCNVLALALIRREYSYQNDYLSDGFYRNRFPAELRLSAVSANDAIAVTDGQGHILAWLSYEAGNGNGQPSRPMVVWMVLAGLLLLFSGGHLLVIRPAVSWLPLAWWLFLLLLRFISFHFRIPEPLYAEPLFSPSEYAASDWLPTLGDLLLNSLLALYTAWLLFREERLLPTALLPFRHLVAWPALVFLTGYAWFTCDLLRGLIIHSSVSLDMSDLLSLSSSSYTAFLIIGLLFASLFLFADRLIRLCIRSGITPARFIVALVITTALAFFLLPQLNEGDPEWPLFIFGLLLVIYLVRRSRRQYNYARVILLLALFAFTGNYLVLKYTRQREEEKRKLLAVKISAERDPIAESLFIETEDNILTDTLLKSYLRPSTGFTGQVRDLGQLYFNGYWEKYTISVNVFGTDECPMTALYTTPVSDPLVFDRLIDSIGVPTLSENFFFLDNGSGRVSYLARLQIPGDEKDSTPLGTLYIEFQSRYTPEEIGYPELLLDKVVSSNTDLSNYSYARYNEGKLVSHYGSYAYGLNDRTFVRRAGNDDPFTFARFNGYDHLIHRSNGQSLVVISLPAKNLLDLLTPFSYLMLFLGLMVFIPYAAQRLQDYRIWRISFKRRVQLSIILVLFLSLVLIGGGTVLYIITNNTQKNHRLLSEKIHSLLVETEYQLEKENELNRARAEDIAYALTRQANVFFADINIFDLSGQLFASSRSKIFEEGLISKKMNPDAFYHLSVRNTTEYIHEERIGKLKYLSAYVPLRNNENRVIGYLNLPYFAKQTELRREISSFVVAIINIYVLLIVLVVIAAIFISNRVTEPLRLVQEKLGNIRLGQKNEMIGWKGNDEIATLIGEYNRMVSELAESAEKLARSERESAWREMAKQVAHEIKNPLTPIKLSIQHLQKAWDDQAPDFDKRLERFSQTLVEQIDTLSHIATEFSNFAQMPRMVREPVDLDLLLRNVIDFYAAAQREMEIRYEHTGSSPAWVYSDKEQLLRAFNNLIRNSIQSIPDNRKGIIGVELSRSNGRYRVSVRDNGSGISEAIREKIFVPNFTTKTGGMGLGLALVKSIVETSGGSVGFETREGEGSVFYVELPVHHPGMA